MCYVALLKQCIALLCVFIKNYKPFMFECKLHFVTLRDNLYVKSLRIITLLNMRDHAWIFHERFWLLIFSISTLHSKYKKHRLNWKINDTYMCKEWLCVTGLALAQYTHHVYIYYFKIVSHCTIIWHIVYWKFHYNNSMLKSLL